MNQPDEFSIIDTPIPFQIVQETAVSWGYTTISVSDLDLTQIEADVVEKAGQAIAQQISEALFIGATPVSHTDSPHTNGVTLDDLMITANKLRSLPPVVTAIWFVDREDLYYQFVRFFGDASRRQENGRFFGIELHLWLTLCIDPETEVVMEPTDTLEDTMKREWSEKRFYPWICNHPGVWMRWSNGNWTQRDVDITPGSAHATLEAYGFGSKQ